MRSFITLDANNICIGYQTSTGEIVANNVIEVTHLVNAESPLSGFMWHKYENETWSAESYEGTTATDPLDLAKQLKVKELREIETTNLATFKSSALGTEKTYLSKSEDMLLLLGQYSIVKGNDHNGSDILWYTVESGNLPHSPTQFTQVFLDASANVATVKYHRATKDYYVGIATTVEEVAAVVW